MQWVYYNDTFLEEEKALIPYNDMAIQRGYAVFDFLKTNGLNPIYLDDHLNRFFFSAEQMRLPITYSKEDLKNIIHELVQKNNVENTGVKITLTGGTSEDGYSIGLPRIIISQHFFKEPTAEQRNKGIRLLLFPHQRQLPHVKSIDYIMPLWLQPYLHQQGADDFLYHHQDVVTECPRSNFFIVTADDKIVTPSMNILKGITRMKLLQKAVQYFEVEERNISLEELGTAKEAFITSTTKQIIPVYAIDNYEYQSNATIKKLQSLLEN